MVGGRGRTYSGRVPITSRTSSPGVSLVYLCLSPGGSQVLRKVVTTPQSPTRPSTPTALPQPLKPAPQALAVSPPAPASQFQVEPKNLAGQCLVTSTQGLSGTQATLETPSPFPALVCCWPSPSTSPPWFTLSGLTLGPGLSLAGTSPSSVGLSLQGVAQTRTPDSPQRPPKRPARSPA